MTANANAKPTACAAMKFSEWMTGARLVESSPPAIFPMSSAPANSGKMRLLCSLSKRFPA